ncbi:DegQ family serine endoprotease [Lacibacterium aquatile]|uniref:Probable periplasmic serine endoprotease DegP-like n=1 Tax=Lacibacterium aquatile TaxID=1168082 RepID=A0ABW5DLX3_9PROT
MTENISTISPAPLLVRLPRALAMAAVAAVLAVGPLAAPTPAFAASAPESFADMAQKLLPSVVNVYTTQTAKQPEQRGPAPDLQLPPGSPFEQFFKDFMNRQRNPNAPPRRQTSLGSGFIIDESGFIVTNNHVIDGADEISVRLHDETELKATLVGKDPRTDLALLKVETSRKLPAVPWGNSGDIRIGDWVLAIGNPFGLGGTVTAGILSARNRSMGGAYDDFLQTDASINRGNSGGPMFNMKGEVIGINSAILSPNGGSVGIGFAIASNLAKPVIEQIRNGGQVKRGWLGVRIQKLDEDVATGFGLDKARGALVSSVQENSPAAKAQIKQGDVILKFDGRDVPESDRLPRIVADTPIGKAVDATVWRNRKEITVKVTVGELKEDEVAAAADPNVPAVTGEVKSLGLTLAGLNAQSREKYGLDESAVGVLVTDAAQDSPAFEKGVRPGDLITEVGQESVKTPNDVSDKIKAARDGKKKSVLLTLSSRGETRFVAVRVD